MAVVAVSVPRSAIAEPAIGQFEIKSLDAEPGEIEIQVLSALSFGQPPLKTGIDASGEPVSDGNSVARQRHAFEIEYGISSTLKARLGIEYEQERTEFFAGQSAGTHFDELNLDEIGGEVVWAAIPRHGDGAGLGFVVEYEQPVSGGGPRSLIGGPIFEWASGPWLASFNPALVQYFGGERNEAGKRDNKIDFSYTARLMYEVSPSVSLAVEAYGTVDRIGSTGAPSDEHAVFGDFNQHRIGPVVYWSLDMDGVPASRFRPVGGGDDGDGKQETPSLMLGLGVLLGVDDNAPDTTLKLSFEAFF